MMSEVMCPIFSTEIATKRTVFALPASGGCNGINTLTGTESFLVCERHDHVGGLESNALEM
jgi:hypothetical protein